MKQPDMENRFYRELSRRLAEEGISTDQPGEKGPPVLHDSRPAVFISALGLAYMPGEGGEAGLVPKELLDTLEGFTDFAALGRLCMGQDGIHSEAPEMEML